MRRNHLIGLAVWLGTSSVCVSLWALGIFTWFREVWSDWYWGAEVLFSLASDG